MYNLKMYLLLNIHILCIIYLISDNLHKLNINYYLINVFTNLGINVLNILINYMFLQYFVFLEKNLTKHRRTHINFHYYSY